MPADASLYRIEPLDERHDRQSFSCGVEPLDRYFRTQASQDVRRRIASCFVAVFQHRQSVAGYYTLAATSVALSDLPDERARRLPRYPYVPATLMGRLAVDRQHRGRGVGEKLLFDALGRALRNEIATYAFIVDAKDDTAISFYSSYGFARLTAVGKRLFLPVAEIAKMLA